ncbi:MAG: hypothetical protein RMM29_04295 [Planctomycetota bacterium]|nr:hypothetical protein [Planctomycetota bacterium]
MSLRIGYLCHYSPSPHSGPGRKVLAQCRIWRACGHQVELWVLTRDPAWEALAESFPLFCHRWASRWQLPAAWQRLRRRLLRRPLQVLYVRQMPWLPGLGALLRRWPSALEIQTDDVAELRSWSPSHLWHRATRACALHAASGFVFMTEELACLPHFRARGQPRIVLPNPLPDAVPLPPPPPGAWPRLIMLATPGQEWNGIDVVLQLAHALPEFGFDLVGFVRPAGAPASPQVQWHGWLEPAQYRALLAQASVGIGTLALWRKRMRQACPLKVREYLAHGLPVIIGYDDPDLPPGVDYALRLHSGDRGQLAAEDIARVRRFVLSWHGRRIEPSRLSHLRAAVRERRRLAFLARLARLPTSSAGVRRWPC